MCHLAMKIFDLLDKILLIFLTKYSKNTWHDPEAKGQGHSKNQKEMT